MVLAVACYTIMDLTATASSRRELKRVDLDLRPAIAADYSPTIDGTARRTLQPGILASIQQDEAWLRASEARARVLVIPLEGGRPVAFTPPSAPTSAHGHTPSPRADTDQHAPAPTTEGASALETPPPSAADELVVPAALGAPASSPVSPAGGFPTGEPTPAATSAAPAAPTPATSTPPTTPTDPLATATPEGPSSTAGTGGTGSSGGSGSGNQGSDNAALGSGNGEGNGGNGNGGSDNGNGNGHGP